MDATETQVCNKCNEAKSVAQYGRYTDPRTGKVRMRKICNPCRTQVEGVRSRENLERSNGYKKKYRDGHKDEIRDYERERVRDKRQNDPVYIRRRQINAQIAKAIRTGADYTRLDNVNCSVGQLKRWLRFQFHEGWDFTDNKNWNIDHVIPLSFFDLNNEQEELIACHWSNIRPVEPNENRRKSDKIIKDTILAHIETIKAFLNENEGYQASAETCWWQRVELWYGQNPDDSEDFKEFLQRTIRS